MTEGKIFELVSNRGNWSDLLTEIALRLAADTEDHSFREGIIDAVTAAGEDPTTLFKMVTSSEAARIRSSVDDSPAEDLDTFHLKNPKGGITGVYDFAILNYIKKNYHILILGGVPYIYEHGVFQPDMSGAILKTMIRSLIYPQFVKASTLKRVFDLFIYDAELQVEADDMNQYPVEWINFLNGFYDPVNKKMIPHDPLFRSTVQIPHKYDPDRTPTGNVMQDWLGMICETQEDIEMLCQYNGLSMTRDTRQQKLLILLGIGGTGKSTLIRMMELVIGSKNVSNISLNQLEKRFAAFGLMGKLLNSCADLEIDALSDVSTLKKILGEDTISAEAKGKDAVSFKSFAKLIFSTNQLPIVKSEQTNGFYRRLLILNMNHVPVKRDPDFFARLSDYIDDFIQINVQALERMYDFGQITESSGSVEAVQRLRNDSDTVEAFLNNEMVRVPDGKVKKLDVYRAYTRFCSDMERQSLTKQNFYKSMRVKGFGEGKTNGVEIFRGIEYREKDQQKHPQISLDEFQNLPDEEVPFQ